MSILVLLKTSTRPQHDSLEHDLDLLNPELTLDDYILVLKRFYGFYKVLEDSVRLPLDRMKTPLLAKDLEFFKVDLNQIELPKTLPVCVSDSRIFGMRYVIEGSTLGSQVLSKHYKEKFYMSPDSGCFFFTGYGSETMKKWKEFQEEILAFSTQKIFNEQEVIESAKETFAFLHQWLISRK